MIYLMAGIVIMCSMICVVEVLARILERFGVFDRLREDMEIRERARHYER